jgi:hypothetical protein
VVLSFVQSHQAANDTTLANVIVILVDVSWGPFLGPPLAFSVVLLVSIFLTTPSQSQPHLSNYLIIPVTRFIIMGLFLQEETFPIPSSSSQDMELWHRL